MNAEENRPDEPLRELGIAPIEHSAMEDAEPDCPRSASIVPLLVLYQQAWNLAQQGEVSLEQLEHAAEASALARAVSCLLAEVGDPVEQTRWAVRSSEAGHLMAVIRDALTQSEGTGP
ncbi:hypothetical protein DNFV4_03063 [Nitrospira tepida]|uniref:Uncharacterized protein n=1 Tax=Nitrospira tepida TaxID=2973512 RepID=A0AA86N0R9_9BACT|nr:hypothetical protein [Nitrospira tepida]CAI4032633.1 hypothetical protein DNFV4_03063 [Nitrospira tepida]